MRRCREGIAAFVIASLVAFDAHAGLYHPDTIAAFDIDKDGNAVVPDFDSFMTMLNLVKKTDNPEQAAYQNLARSIERRLQRPDLTPAEQIALVTDLLRLRNYPSSKKIAANRLSDLKRNLPEGMEFLVYSLMAEMHQRSSKTKREDDDSDLQAAYDHADSAVFDYPFPKQLHGLSSSQLNWYRRIESEYYVPLLRQRAEERRSAKKSPLDAPDAIFPPRNRDKSKQIHFVGESGQFELGTIAPAEKTKLPPDAIAIVQQLILWNPNDGRLWWLLAELYNAKGDILAAERAYKVCKEDEVKFTPSAMLERAHQVADAAAALRGLEAAFQDAYLSESAAMGLQEIAERERKKRWVIAGVATVIIAVVYWQVREVARRLRRRRLRLSDNQRGS